jgi:hypothetical protein
LRSRTRIERVAEASRVGWTTQLAKVSVKNDSVRKKPPARPKYKNNLPKGGVFFDVKDMSLKTPHQPRIAPQIHHDLPPQKHPKSAKPPVKDHIDTP